MTPSRPREPIILRQVSRAGAPASTPRRDAERVARPRAADRHPRAGDQPPFKPGGNDPLDRHQCRGKIGGRKSPARARLVAYGRQPHVSSPADFRSIYPRRPSPTRRLPNARCWPTRRLLLADAVCDLLFEGEAARRHRQQRWWNIRRPAKLTTPPRQAVVETTPTSSRGRRTMRLPRRDRLRPERWIGGGAVDLIANLKASTGFIAGAGVRRPGPGSWTASATAGAGCSGWRKPGELMTRAGSSAPPGGRRRPTARVESD